MANLSEAAVNRRIEFLLNEAKSKDPTNDQTVVFALRVLSNWACVHRDCSSAAVKLLNPLRSRAANELSRSINGKGEWVKQTINEHQKPLKEVWKWIKDNAQTLTVEDVKRELQNHPMVTVTKEEDRLLRQLGSETLEPAERYRRAGIEIINIKQIAQS